jgi:hypothetical integral membrane protein (TIGR02206 family)
MRRLVVRSCLTLLTIEHVGAIAAVVGVTAGLTIGARVRPGRWLTVLSRILAILIVVAEPSYWVTQISNGTWAARYDLPLQLSNASELVAAAALWWPKPILVELTYFWGLGGVLQALATPDFTQHFPDPAFFRFYVTHGGVLAAAVLLVFGRRIYPRPGAPLRIFLITIGFTVIVGVADILTGGNYMYLRVKPAAGTLLNFMGPWPWYIASGALLAVVLLTVLYAPFWLMRRRAESAGVGQDVFQIRAQDADAHQRETEGD